MSRKVKKYPIAASTPLETALTPTDHNTVPGTNPSPHTSNSVPNLTTHTDKILKILRTVSGSDMLRKRKALRPQDVDALEEYDDAVQQQTALIRKQLTTGTNATLSVYFPQEQEQEQEQEQGQDQDHDHDHDHDEDQSGPMMMEEINHFQKREVPKAKPTKLQTLGIGDADATAAPQGLHSSGRSFSEQDTLMQAFAKVVPLPSSPRSTPLSNQSRSQDRFNSVSPRSNHRHFSASDMYTSKNNKDKKKHSASVAAQDAADTINRIHKVEMQAVAVAAISASSSSVVVAAPAGAPPTATSTIHKNTKDKTQHSSTNVHPNEPSIIPVASPQHPFYPQARPDHPIIQSQSEKLQKYTKEKHKNKRDRTFLSPAQNMTSPPRRVVSEKGILTPNSDYTTDPPTSRQQRKALAENFLTANTVGTTGEKRPASQERKLAREKLANFISEKHPSSLERERKLAREKSTPNANSFTQDLRNKVKKKNRPSKDESAFLSASSVAVDQDRVDNFSTAVSTPATKAVKGDDPSGNAIAATSISSQGDIVRSTTPQRNHNYNHYSCPSYDSSTLDTVPDKTSTARMQISPAMKNSGLATLVKRISITDELQKKSSNRSSSDSLQKGLSGNSGLSSESYDSDSGGQTYVIEEEEGGLERKRTTYLARGRDNSLCVRIGTQSAYDGAQGGDLVRFESQLVSVDSTVLRSKTSSTLASNHPSVISSQPSNITPEEEEDIQFVGEIVPFKPKDPPTFTYRKLQFDQIQFEQNNISHGGSDVSKDSMTQAKKTMLQRLNSMFKREIKSDLKPKTELFKSKNASSEISLDRRNSKNASTGLKKRQSRIVNISSPDPALKPPTPLSSRRFVPQAAVSTDSTDDNPFEEDMSQNFKKLRKFRHRNKRKSFTHCNSDLDLEENPYISCTVVEPSIKATAAIIFLHGLGDRSKTWEAVFAAMGYPHIRFIFPNAPRRIITYTKIAKTRAWADVYGLSMEDQDDHEGILKSTRRIINIIKAETERGIKPQRIMIGGFSQGGMIALTLALRTNYILAAAFGLSTWLSLFDTYPKALGQPMLDRAFPILMCHGDADKVVKLEWGSKSAEKLQNMNIPCTFRVYKDLNHGIQQSEMTVLSLLIARVLPIEYEDEEEEEEIFSCESSRQSKKTHPNEEHMTRGGRAVHVNQLNEDKATEDSAEGHKTGSRRASVVKISNLGARTDSGMRKINNLGRHGSAVLKGTLYTQET